MLSADRLRAAYIFRLGTTSRFCSDPGLKSRHPEQAILPLGVSLPKAQVSPQEIPKLGGRLDTDGSICVHEGEPLFHVDASRVGPPSWRRSDSRVDERQACRPSRCTVPSTRRLAAAPSLRWGFLISQLEYVLGGGGSPDFADTSKKANAGAGGVVMASKRKFSDEYKREAIRLVVRETTASASCVLLDSVQHRVRRVPRVPSLWWYRRQGPWDPVRRVPARCGSSSRSVGWAGSHRKSRSRRP
jgi:hypothetical protein